MEIILLITAIILSVIFYPIGYIYVIILSIMRRSWRKVRGYTKALALELALTLDRTGNVLARDLFNDLMIQPKGYQFGKWRETISSVLGKNKRDGTLKPTGKLLADILDWIDPNHCIKSIDETV